MIFDHELTARRALTDNVRKGILEGDATLQKAIDGDTTAAAKVWSTIADGTASVGRILLWATHTAGRVDRDVIQLDTAQPGEKARGALKAIGFRGPIDQHIEIRELFAALDGFENTDGEETHKMWVGICRSHGLLSGLDDTQAYRLIRDIRQGKR